MQAFLSPHLIVLLNFVPVELFIPEIKGYVKKKKKSRRKNKTLVWPRGMACPLLDTEYNF